MACYKGALPCSFGDYAAVHDMETRHYDHGVIFVGPLPYERAVEEFDRLAEPWADVVDVREGPVYLQGSPVFQHIIRGIGVRRKS